MCEIVWYKKLYILCLLFSVSVKEIRGIFVLKFLIFQKIDCTFVKITYFS